MERSKADVLEQVLLEVPDKFEHKDTTSRLWKKQLVEIIWQYEIQSVLEIGAARGHTTHILAPFVTRITSVELSKSRQKDSQDLNASYSNINYRSDDVYSTDWKDYGNHDLVIIDCMHTFEAVVSDIENACTYVKPKYLAFDDYGLFPDVKRAVDAYLQKGVLEVLKEIGHAPGTIMTGPSNANTVPNRKLIAPEGVFCKVNY